MEYRGFGRSGVKVSALGMGTYYDPLWIAGSFLLGHHRGREEKVKALRIGFDLGMNLVDTAEIYGTEPVVAKATKSYRRDELFIATKVWPSHLHYDGVLRSARRSLTRLQSSYIDLYQVHWPNPRVPIRETMRAMERLIDEGMIRHIGVSNFSLAQVREAEEALSKYQLISNQVEYNLRARRIERDLLPYCERNRIAILPYKPLAHGALARPSGRSRDVMNEISLKHRGKTPAQIALNWLLSRGAMVFPIPRASRSGRVIEDAGAVGWELDIDDLAKLEAL